MEVYKIGNRKYRNEIKSDIKNNYDVILPPVTKQQKWRNKKEQNHTAYILYSNIIPWLKDQKQKKKERV